MLLQSGPIAPSSLGLWAVTFLLGGIVVILAWLVRRHYAYSVPAYRRIFGDDNDPTSAGYLKDSETRFKEMKDDHDELWSEVTEVRKKTDELNESQLRILHNQEQIANKLDVNLVDDQSRYSDDD
jgi:hypothetical protein